MKTTVLAGIGRRPAVKGRSAGFVDFKFPGQPTRAVHQPAVQAQPEGLPAVVLTLIEGEARVTGWIDPDEARQFAAQIIEQANNADAERAALQQSEAI